MQKFWATATVHHHLICFKMNNKKHIVNLEYFRETLQICPKLPDQQFEEPPFEEAILMFLSDLGHSEEIKVITDVNVNKLHQPWRSFIAVISKCLSGKSTGYDSLRLSQAQILWRMYHKKNVDYAYLLWEDFVYQVENKNVKRSNEMYYPRFTKTMIDDDDDNNDVDDDADNQDDKGQGDDNEKTDSDNDDVSVTTIAELPLLSAIILPPPPIPLITHLQQTLVPTPATVPSSSLQDLNNFSSLFGIVDVYLANKMHEAIKTATSHVVATNLSELELKKILINKMKSNKSIHRSDEQKNLYKALVDAYESDKLVLDTYGDTISFKRCQDDEDKYKEPSAGSNQGSKRRRAGKEP
ncbi:hypothetical protein Tco_0311690 [Tanacetum coccineum]